MTEQDLKRLWGEIDRLWEQTRQLRERAARGWELGVPDGVAVYNSGDLTISTSTWTALTFDSERRDDAGFHSTVSNTDRLTVPAGKAGWYCIFGHISFEPGAGTRRLVALHLNGTTYYAIQRGEVSASTPMRVCVATALPLAAADYVRLLVYHDAGGDLDVTANGNYSPEFRMIRVV